MQAYLHGPLRRFVPDMVGQILNSTVAQHEISLPHLTYFRGSLNPRTLATPPLDAFSPTFMTCPTAHHYPTWWTGPDRDRLYPLPHPTPVGRELPTPLPPGVRSFTGRRRTGCLQPHHYLDNGSDAPTVLVRWF